MCIPPNPVQGVVTKSLDILEEETVPVNPHTKGQNDAFNDSWNESKAS